MNSATNKSYQEKIWHQHYATLIAFQKSTGREYPNASDPEVKLYHWCKNQRRFYTKNQMSQERKGFLDKINFRWNTLHYSFEVRLQQLLAFKKEHGTLHVSQVKYDKTSDVHKLSRWVNEIRRMYNENRISMDRIKQLDKIGFIWNMEDERFASNLFKLKRYHKQNGHFDVPQTGRNKKLGEWIAQVRCRGLAKRHYIKALDDIGFEWLGKKKRLQKAKSTMVNIDLKNKIIKGRIKARKTLKNIV
ncbi:MAG: helicase associated domain-containing protein [Cyclobacteriaceae bacterium]|nr:helicase associated domain-containing protein [Cyclobacteriaceae bacterium]